MKSLWALMVWVTTGMNVQGQDYEPFPTDSATWTYLRCDEQGTWPITYDCRTLRYTLWGDTIIESVPYKVIYESSMANSLGSYYTAVREDPSKILWIKESEGVTEWKRFNFGGSVGDTMQGRPFNATTITQVDSVMTLVGYRNRYLTSDSKDTILEGIGNLSEVIGSWGTYTSTYFRLLCHNQNGTDIYRNQYYNTCDTAFVHVGVLEKAGLLQLPVIHPNPFATFAILRLSNNGFRMANYEVRLYDLSGQLVREQAGLSGGSVTLERGGLPAGMYFVVVEAEDGILARQKVIIR